MTLYENQHIRIGIYVEMGKLQERLKNTEDSQKLEQAYDAIKKLRTSLEN